MNKIKKTIIDLPIAGLTQEVEIGELDVDSLILDKDNPRIGFFIDSWKEIREDFSQEQLANALEENIENIERLKINIESNKGITVPIWVCKSGKNYIVIDGNTRVMIYRELKKKHPEIYKKIKAYILPENTTDKTKNFIRLLFHLRGSNNWEVYERARAIYNLWMKGDTEEDLASKTKLSISQIKRWREAYQNMTEQFLSKYGEEPDSLSKFSYFIEYENPKIKDGMEISGLTIGDFSDWVGKNEIRKAQDVRNLKIIFNDKEATKLLVKKGYAAAIERLKFTHPETGSELFESIEEVITGLRDMSRLEEEEIIKGESPSKRDLIKELHKELEKIVRKI